MKKKKILISIFLIVITVTAFVFLKAAIDSYHYDRDPANGVDIMEGMGAAMLVMMGGLVILCETDLFFTVYYFFMKPKTLSKSVLMIISQLMLLTVIFSEDLAKFLSHYVSDAFKEEIIVILPIFFFYVILRAICVSLCFSKKSKASF